MSPLGFLFLLVAVDPPWTDNLAVTDDQPSESETIPLSAVPIAPEKWLHRVRNWLCA